jgi:hypothetical protein
VVVVVAVVVVRITPTQCLVICSRSTSGVGTGGLGAATAGGEVGVARVGAGLVTEAGVAGVMTAGVVLVVLVVGVEEGQQQVAGVAAEVAAAAAEGGVGAEPNPGNGLAGCRLRMVLVIKLRLRVLAVFCNISVILLTGHILNVQLKSGPCGPTPGPHTSQAQTITGKGANVMFLLNHSCIATLWQQVCCQRRSTVLVRTNTGRSTLCPVQHNVAATAGGRCSDDVIRHFQVTSCSSNCLAQLRPSGSYISSYIQLLFGCCASSIRPPVSLRPATPTAQQALEHNCRCLA